MYVCVCVKPAMKMGLLREGEGPAEQEARTDILCSLAGSASKVEKKCGVRVSKQRAPRRKKSKTCFLVVNKYVGLGQCGGLCVCA